MSKITYLVIWIAAIFVIMNVYTSFEQSTRGFQQTIMIDRAATQKRSHNELILQKSRNGHFHANLIANDQKLHCLVDTGATNVTMGLNQATQLGLQPNTLNFNRKYHTANGVIYGANTILYNAKLGHFIIPKLNISVSKRDMNTCLIGMSLLKYFTLQFRGDNLYINT